MKSWIQFLSEQESLNETRFKGLLRKFRQSNDMPDYVAKDLYNNRVAYQMRKMLQAGLPQAEVPTIGMDGDTATTTSGSSINLNIIDKNKFGDVVWSKNPVVVNVHPDNFDDFTLNIFLHRRFGLGIAERIRNDAQRTQIQTSMLNQGENEPIIMIKDKDKDKYEMIEGWHRVMANLLYTPDPNIGAPPDQIDLLKKGDMTRIDFTRWKPVRIRAYIGTRG